MYSWRCEDTARLFRKLALYAKRFFHMISSFNKLSREQEPFAGGKGRTLARLYRAGYRVPDGFIILATKAAASMPAAFVGDELTIEAWAQVQAHLAHMRRDASEDRKSVV